MVLSGVLSVIDDFDRAHKSISESNDIEAVKTGINLIYTKFNEFVNHQGVKEIIATNVEFNTDLHEAVTRFPAPSEEMKGKVIDVIQKGYTLNDKVIRFAKVVVGE
jgi:molecular chaperone GrpE